MSRTNGEPDVLRVAEEFARSAHEGQIRKSGEPYITHVETVVRQLSGDSDAEIVGWLHDVIEDTDASRQDLLEAGVPERLIREIEVLTKLREETYSKYINRIRASELATRVKKADIIANLLDSPGNKQIRKFARALESLCN